ncbi:hypothetical protein CEXT_800101 [Caerostris extrusa]|uniref:Uncharacterized protein n=1 Tax=Caerostris extrusa TaxID=172846 RepID=A0AAV4WSU7_CAEEX|nr:hypothetical protein CEXT_800101 [Caerostris extrusa]
MEQIKDLRSGTWNIRTLFKNGALSNAIEKVTFSTVKAPEEVEGLPPTRWVDSESKEILGSGSQQMAIYCSETELDEGSSWRLSWGEIGRRADEEEEYIILLIDI